ncbi:MAG: carbohydrate ABC transporter permease [Nitrososphaeria archaeon]
MKFKNILNNVFFLIFLVVVTIIWFFPPFLMFLNSLKTYEEIYNPRFLLPPKPTLINYLPYPLGVADPLYFIWIFNSTIIGFGTALISVGASLPAAYAVSRMQFKLKTFFSKSVLLMYLFPSSFLFIGYMKLIGGLGLYNNPLIIALIDSAIASPYCMWLLGGYLTVAAPKEIEEAAYIDGCNRFQVLLKIIFPIMIPGIIAALMYAFVIGWDEYLYALLFLNEKNTWNLNIGMSNLVIGDYAPWNQLFALATINVIPPTVLFMIIQNRIVMGLAAGATKL